MRLLRDNVETTRESVTSFRTKERKVGGRDEEEPSPQDKPIGSTPTTLRPEYDGSTSLPSPKVTREQACSPTPKSSSRWCMNGADG